MLSETVLEHVIAYIFGHKYYANIVNMIGTADCSICSFIFGSREEAERHKEELQTNRTYKYIETISFRSRRVSY
jgi:hypothetical protein|nr:MAG TPA: C2H2 type zinc-finger protein [Caudoviricetes sp.]